MEESHWLAVMKRQEREVNGFKYILKKKFWLNLLDKDKEETKNDISVFGFNK